MTEYNGLSKQAVLEAIAEAKVLYTLSVGRQIDTGTTPRDFENAYNLMKKVVEVYCDKNQG